MAVQAALIAETIAAMKRTLHERCDAPGFHDLALQSTNRGQKLKRKAEYVHEGQLSDAKVYKRKIEYAGYLRYILSQNPKRYDDYGDELDDDEADEKADAEAAEENPYSEIKLEELLMPLTSAAELPNHPSMSTSYKSAVLADMVQQTCEMIHKERKTLCDIKNLLIRFRGDATWVAGECIISTEDAALFEVPKLYHDAVAPLQNLQAHDPIATEGQTSDSGIPNIGVDIANDQQDTMLAQHDTQGTMSIEYIDEAESLQPKADTKSILQSLTTGTAAYASGSTEVRIQDFTENRPLQTGLEFGGASEVEGDNHASNEISIATQKPDLANDNTNISISNTRDFTNMQTNSADEVNTEMTEAPTAEETAATPAQEEITEGVQVPMRRMTTRAQAQAVSDKTLSSHTRTPSPEPSDPPLIHRLYIVPPASIPDRDFGLPTVEAEETRRILMMWVQKQEEVCRGVERLYDGLLKAKRMQKTVYKWCKAEGHVGEMSDGEDWYDKEEWALEEDLKKGQLEEEDDTAIQGKKTRGRRVAQ